MKGGEGNEQKSNEKRTNLNSENGKVKEEKKV